MADTWLVADIGGTTSRLGLASPRGLDRSSIARIDNDSVADACDLLARYLAKQAARPVAICAGVAGPVHDRAARLTNRDWRIEAGAVARATGATRVVLVNDLQAQAHALDDLDLASADRAFHPPEVPCTSGPRLVLGLGTGCNIAIAHDTGDGLFVPPAEAGHSRLPHIPALGPLMAQIAATHLPVEAFLSGPGLSRLHATLGHAAVDPGVILDAMRRGAPDTAETARVFATLLGHVAGDFALIHMATRGVFLIGGLARAIAPCLDAGLLRAAFEDKGPYTDIMRAIPISVVQDDDAALLGCASVLRRGL